MQFTEEQFTQAMRDAVAERGEDFVYSVRSPTWRCNYTEADGSIGCLIGLALSKIDPSLVPKHRSQIPAIGVLSSLTTEKVAEAANKAQYEQDTGKTWGEALSMYLKWVGRDE